MSNRATKQEMIAREKRIQELISNGYTQSEILDVLSKEFKCTENAIKIQYYEILNSMQKRLIEERELIRMEIAQQLLEVQRKANMSGANKVVIEAAMARAKLLGLNEKVEAQVERPKTILFKEKDMSSPLTVVPTEDKVENE